MNAKEQYKLNYSHVRSSKSRRWAIDNGYGSSMDNQSMKSYRMATVKNTMTFKQFIDCMEAAACGLAYATRNHWFFIVNGDELQFTKEECARFSRYFTEGFGMSLDGYTKIIKAGGLYINERLFEDNEVFQLRVKLNAYHRFVIGNGDCDPAKWITAHEIAEVFAKARERHNDAIIATYGSNNRLVGRELRNGEVWLVEPKANLLYKEFEK